ncbi:MAG: peptidyl-prolyl cis-trans isomerase [Solirubrobacteraceae bacterium]
MRISRKLAAVAAFFVIGAAVAGCGSSIPGNSVATVAGNPITLQAFNHWAYVAAKEQAAQAAREGEALPPIVSSNPTNFASCMKAIRAGIPTLRTAADATLKSDCKQVYSSTETEVMNFLIQSYWIQAAAHKAGINGSNLSAKFDKALSKQYPTKAKVNAYLAAALKSSGQTKADMVFTYRVQSLLEKLIKRAKKPVTSKAIAAYYAAHKSTFGSAETRDLHLIRTKTQSSAQAAYNALKGGQSWDTVAKHYAADASAKANGGSLSNATSGEEESAASKAIFSAPLNQLTGPVKGLFGYYVLEVSKITPATQESLAKATPAIKSQLNSTGSQSAEQDVLKAAQKAWTNQTKCRSPNYTTSYCSNYVKPKTTTTATSTPPSTATTPSAGTTTASNTTTTSTK